MTRWVIDGMNVIGSRPDGWWRDRQGAQRRLVEELARLPDSVTVVFDGREHPIDAAVGVEVLFASARGRDAADHDIAELVAADADPATLTVVTSDSELVARVERRGASTLGAGAFRRRLSDEP